MKKVILTENAPAPIGPYSQAVEMNGFVYCSGQIPLDAKTGEIIGENVEAQTEKVMQNISEVLKAADLDFKSVIKTTIFITDMANFQKLNAVYAKYFGDQPPARSTVAVRGLPKDVLVEIEVLAARG